MSFMPLCLTTAVVLCCDIDSVILFRTVESQLGLTPVLIVQKLYNVHVLYYLFYICL